MSEYIEIHSTKMQSFENFFSDNHLHSEPLEDDINLMKRNTNGIQKHECIS